MVYKRILLIDDDEDDQRFFKEAVEGISDSAVVSVIDNGIDALKKLAAKQIVADLIFLDLNMPLMKGEEFLAEIRKDSLLKSIPIIVLTTSSGQNVIDSTRALGAIDFFTKPSSMNELTQLLRPLLAIA